MRTYDISRPPELINIGFDGENKWRPRGFNCTNWLKKHPDGIITLWIQPEGVKKAFPVSTTKIKNTIIWYPLSEELYPGSGELQLVIQDGEFIGKSDTIKFEVNKSLIPGGAHPDSQPSWATKMVDDVTAQANRATEAADRAEQASGEEAISEVIEDYFSKHPVVVEETDPTVPSWAKQPDKPNYTAAEVGALPDTYTPPVQSVNGKTGAVTITAAELGALTEHQSLAAYRTASAQDTIDAAQDAAIAAKYTKPSGGIPASDLADDVKTSLEKADTALQEHQSLSGYATESWVQQQGYLTQHQDISGKADKIPRIAKASTDTVATIEPNKLYVFPEMASLEITLAAITDATIVNEYHFIFESGSTATVLTLPATVLQPDGFTVDANMVYEVSIMEGCMTAQGWAVTA